MAFDLSTAQPVHDTGQPQQRPQDGGFDLSSAQPVGQQEQPQQQPNYGASAVPLEFMAAFNRGATRLADFLTTDQINAVSEILGSEFRVPSITETLSPGTQGGFMDDGLARDVVRTGGEMVAPGAVAGRALRDTSRVVSEVPTAMRGARDAAGRQVQNLPQLGRGSESTARGTLRQMGATTAGQDVRMAAGAGAGMELGGAAGEEMGGETGRQVGEMAGAMGVPAGLSGARSLTSETVKSIVRGRSSRQQIRSTIEDFGETGSMPTLSQATDSPTLQGAENMSSRYWGGGRIRRVHDEVSKNIQRRLGELADDVSIDAGVDRAGRTIQRGISGPGGFVDRFKARSGNLWSRVDDTIGPDAAVEINSTKGTLARLVRDDEFGEILNNPQLARIKQVLDDADIVDYQTLKELRSTIGRRISNNDLISDIPRAELKQIYGAITDDIRTAAELAGPEAAAAFTRANNFTRAGHRRLDDFVERVASKVDVDQVFAAVNRGSEGAQTINAIKRSLNKDEWNTVVSNIIRQMGRATPGQQGADGEVFSVNKFLTDWNRLGPAKRALFSGTKELNQHGKYLDRIARQAERMKFSAQEAANPSGTGQFSVKAGTAITGVGALATGNVPVMSSVLASIGANNLGARLMTSPRFVRWLADGMELPPAAQAEHMAKLVGITKGMSLDDAAAVNGLLEDLQAQGVGGHPKNAR